MIFPENKIWNFDFFCQKYSFIENSGKNVLAGSQKKFYRIQHPEIYLLDLKVQYKRKIKLPLDIISKHVFLYLCLPDNIEYNKQPRLVENHT